MPSRPADPDYRELLLGCGHRRDKDVVLLGTPSEWQNLTTLDCNPDCRPDIEWDLTRQELPFDADTFAEIHAYEVLEHLGNQGDFRTFFAQFEDYWRILKPGGFLCGSVPAPGSQEVWGDPGHTRAFMPMTFGYLAQPTYDWSSGNNMQTDYRRWYRGDFEPKMIERKENRLFFALQAVKPARIVP